MSTNREYKDSVFVKLFNDKDKLIELYNAIEHTDYPSDTEVEIITLDDVLYNVRKNDLGFQIEKRLKYANRTNWQYICLNNQKNVFYKN